MIGSLRLAHDLSIDEVDQKILGARYALIPLWSVITLYLSYIIIIITFFTLYMLRKNYSDYKYRGLQGVGGMLNTAFNFCAFILTTLI